MILIIEDDAGLAATLERMLRYTGHDAVAVGNGTEALSLLQIRKPKLVVLDMGLPVMGGMTVLKAIRSEASLAAIPVLVYTADFSDDVRREAVREGAQDFVVKGTVGWESLIQRIEMLLAAGESRLRLSE